MSLNQKIIAALIGIGVAVGVGIFVSKNNAVAPVADETATTTATTTGTASKDAGGASSKKAPAASVSGESSTAVDNDMAAVDAQLNAIATDESNADQGINDAPGEQSY